MAYLFGRHDAQAHAVGLGVIHDALQAALDDRQVASVVLAPLDQVVRIVGRLHLLFKGGNAAILKPRASKSQRLSQALVAHKLAPRWAAHWCRSRARSWRCTARRWSSHGHRGWRRWRRESRKRALELRSRVWHSFGSCIVVPVLGRVVRVHTLGLSADRILATPGDSEVEEQAVAHAVDRAHMRMVLNVVWEHDVPVRKAIGQAQVTTEVG